VGDAKLVPALFLRPVNDSSDPLAPSDAALRPPSEMPRALLVDVEPATAALIELWLADAGLALDLAAGPGVAVVLVATATPRQFDRRGVQALAALPPGVPIILLSPTFFSGVPARGEVARELGVAAVLATPLAREHFTSTVRDVLARPR